MPKVSIKCRLVMVFSKLLVERFKTKMENKKSDLKVISGMRTCDGVTTSSSKFSNQSTPPQDSLTHDLTSQATSMQTQDTETSETDSTQASNGYLPTRNIHSINNCFNNFLQSVVHLSSNINTQTIYSYNKFSNRSQ